MVGPALGHRPYIYITTEKVGLCLGAGSDQRQDRT